MSRLRLALFLGGLALFLGLILQRGTADVAHALATVGWGVVGVSLFHLLPLTANTLGWRFVIPGRQKPSFGQLLWMRWVGESMNNLLPVGQVGGDLLRARLLARRGVRGPLAGASVVVDFTLGLVTQAVFALLGVALLLTTVGGGEQSRAILLASLAVLVLLGLFLLLQQRGLFGFGARLITRLAGDRSWRILAGNARRLDRAVRGLYARKKATRDCAVTRMASWLLGTGETWLTLYLLGVPVSLADALILESLGYAVRSAAFAVPGALGVQEGGFMLLGALVGLDPTEALVLSLVKRVREVFLGVPGILSWLLYESREG